jgi:hypothetical protein
VVPGTVYNVHAYICDRQALVAEQRMSKIAATKSHGYPQIAVAMTMVPQVRQAMHIDPKMPSSELEHTSPAQSCEACREAARCNLSPVKYVDLRTKLEQVARRVPDMDVEMCTRLQDHLNAHVI